MKVVFAIVVLFVCQAAATPLKVSAPQEDPKCLDINGNPVSNLGFEKEGDCENFYQCSNGLLYVMPCPDGQSYDPDVSRCVYSSLVPGCGAPTTTTVPPTTTTLPPLPTTTQPPPTTTTASPNFNDNCKDTNGKPISSNPFEKPGDCDHFYQCGNGYLYVMPCATGTVFNPAIGVCDWPYNVPDCNKEPNEVIQVICEHETDTVSCPGKQKIKVVDAYYGRQDGTTCLHGPVKVTTCRAANSHAEISSFCNSHNSCTLHASNSVFGDPCYGTFKYVKVLYQCVN